jgi:hypothetical protein
MLPTTPSFTVTVSSALCSLLFPDCAALPHAVKESIKTAAASSVDAIFFEFHNNLPPKRN